MISPRLLEHGCSFFNRYLAHRSLLIPPNYTCRYCSSQPAHVQSQTQHLVSSPFPAIGCKQGGWRCRAEVIALSASHGFVERARRINILPCEASDRSSKLQPCRSLLCHVIDNSLQVSIRLLKHPQLTISARADFHDPAHPVDRVTAT